MEGMGRECGNPRDSPSWSWDNSTPTSTLAFLDKGGVLIQSPSLVSCFRADSLAMIPRARDFRSFEFILFTVYRQLSLAIDSGCRIRPKHIALGRFDLAPANSVYRAGDERRMGCLAFVVITPVARWALIARGTAYSNRFPVPSGCGLPHPNARLASTLVVSRPARRSLVITACRFAESPSDPFFATAPTLSFPPRVASIATG